VVNRYRARLGSSCDIEYTVYEHKGDNVRHYRIHILESFAARGKHAGHRFNISMVRIITCNIQLVHAFSFQIWSGTNCDKVRDYWTLIRAQSYATALQICCETT